MWSSYGNVEGEQGEEERLNIHSDEQNHLRRGKTAKGKSTYCGDNMKRLTQRRRGRDGYGNLLSELSSRIRHCFVRIWRRRARRLVVVLGVFLLMLCLTSRFTVRGRSAVGGEIDDDDDNDDGGKGNEAGEWWWESLLGGAERVERRIGQTKKWKEFLLLNAYYSGINKLVPISINIPEYPPRKKPSPTPSETVTKAYLPAQSQRYSPFSSSTFGLGYVECDYHDYDENGTILFHRPRPELRVFSGVPEGYPDPVFGSYELLGLESEGVCWDRYGRLGAYGFGYGEEEGGLGVGLAKRGGEGKKLKDEGVVIQKIDWRGIDWRRVQSRCLKQNSQRFIHTRRGAGGEADDGVLPLLTKNPKDGDNSGVGKIKRTAILVRTWDSYTYTPNDILHLRALISELSISTGGEYTVHLLVHVKDPQIPIFSDPETYTSHLQKSVPTEFWGIATLWSEPLMGLVYTNLKPNEFRGLPVHGVYRSSFMPVQWFASRHPEYEWFWNWEMDARYIGHWGELFEKVSMWARKQRRRGLWERSGRFYLPSIHGSWDEFTRLVERRVGLEETVWGAVKVDGVELSPDDSTPPPFFTPQEEAAHAQDNATYIAWGVDEDADLITFNPLFDPDHTDWLLSKDTTGYRTSTPLRRASIIAASRLSRRLLLRMHSETAHHGRTAFTEMWPATVALQHGFKAVYVPHPVYVDRMWPLWYLEKTVNHGPQGQAGGSKESVFGEGREHNFRGSTWYYNAKFAGRLVDKWINGKRRMCLRGMLVHPIKNRDGGG